VSLISLGHLRPIATLLSSNAVAALIIAGGAVLVSRNVTPTTFGGYSYAVQLALSVYPALTLRYEHALPLYGNRRVARTHLLFASIALSIVGTVLLLLIGGLGLDLVAPTIGLEPVILDLFPLIVFAAFSLAIASIHQSAALACGNLTRMAIARVLRALVMVLLQILFVLAISTGVTWLLIADIVANLVQAVFLGVGIGMAGLLPLLRRPLAQLRRRIAVLLKRQSVFPLVSLPHMLVFSALGLLHVTIFGYFFGADALGHYYLMRRLVFGVLGLFSTAIYQHSIADAAKVPKAMVYGVALRASVLVGGVTAVSSGVIAIFGPGMFALVAGSEWAMAGRLAVASIPLILMEPITSTLAFVAVFLGLQKVAFAVAVVQGSIGVGMIAITANLEWNVIDATWASSLATSVFMLCYVMWLLQRARRARSLNKA